MPYQINFILRVPCHNKVISHKPTVPTKILFTLVFFLSFLSLSWVIACVVILFIIIISISISISSSSSRRSRSIFSFISWVLPYVADPTLYFLPFGSLFVQLHNLCVTDLHPAPSLCNSVGFFSVAIFCSDFLIYLAYLFNSLNPFDG